MSDAAATFTATLEAYSRAARDAVTKYVSGRQPDRHLYDPAREFVMRPAKTLRPALCLAACEAFGGGVDDALASAVAIELLHAAFLIHDDIEDGSEKRRGRAALHVERGVPIALNTGDALAVLSLRPLLENVGRLGSRMARAVLAEFQLAMERTVEGQAVELGWREDNVVDLTPRDYLDMVLQKTCAYTTILPLRVGALIGSTGGADLDAIGRLGFALGAAFQIRDDVLDLVSARASYGKDVLGDIRESKRTLALIHLLRSAPADARAGLVALLGRTASERTPEDGFRVRALMEDHGSIAYADAYASALAGAAVTAFDEAFSQCAPSRAYTFLRGVVPYMIERVA